MSTPSSAGDSIAANRATWNAMADQWADAGRRGWSTDEITWGEYANPEFEVGALPDVAGLEVVEIGCGTGYVSAWLARRGAARVVGVDPTEGQLATARRLQREIGPSFPLVQAAGEAVPLSSGSFDLAVSEYGAAIWADPYLWIPEAARLLRPGGELVFLAGSVLFTLCAPDSEDPAGDRLVRDQRGMHRVTYTGDESVEFHLPHGEMLRLLRRSGFDVVDLIELHAPEGAVAAAEAAGERTVYVTAEWARRWPSEEIWRARRL